MTFRRNRTQAIDPAESGSLNDLAFLLIIYFIVIAGFNVNLGFLMNLPEKGSTRLVTTQDIFRVMISPTGDWESEGQVFTSESFETALRQKLGSQPNLTLLVKINPMAPYGSLVGIIEVAQRNRVDNFSFSQEESP